MVRLNTFKKTGPTFLGSSPAGRLDMSDATWLWLAVLCGSDVKQKEGGAQAELYTTINRLHAPSRFHGP